MKAKDDPEFRVVKNLGSKDTEEKEGSSKTVESSDEVTAAFCEYLSTRLGLSASIVVGSSEEGKISFAVQGTDAELAGLIFALLQMAPPSVRKEIMRLQIDVTVLGS